MDAVEILLSFVVGFSVSVSLILGYIEESMRNIAAGDGGENTEQLNPEEFTSPEIAESNCDDSGEKGSIFGDIAESNCDDRCEKDGIFGDLAESNCDDNGEKDRIFGDIAESNCDHNGQKDEIFGDIAENNCDNNGEKGGIFGDDLDWLGIERSELERVFGEALVFATSERDRIDRDLKLKLYGLSQIALLGPCCRSRPVAFKLSAHSKWNAWRKLGNMSREAAMEKYIDILSAAVPGWKKGGEGTVTIEDAAAISENSHMNMSVVY